MPVAESDKENWSDLPHNGIDRILYLQKSLFEPFFPPPMTENKTCNGLEKCSVTFSVKERGENIKRGAAIIRMRC